MTKVNFKQRILQSPKKPSVRIYKIVDDYYSGAYVERNDSEVNARFLLGDFPESVESNDSQLKISNLYDNRAAEEPDTYYATRVVFVDQYKEETGADHNVVIFVRITYKTMNISGSVGPGIMLTQVSCGVVSGSSTGSYFCEEMYTRYKVCGDAYTSGGTRVGWKSNESSETQTFWPVVGTSYTIAGPNDYYYDKSVAGTVIAGITRAHIMLKHSSSYNNWLDVGASITNYL